MVKDFQFGEIWGHASSTKERGRRPTSVLDAQGRAVDRRSGGGDGFALDRSDASARQRHRLRGPCPWRAWRGRAAADAGGRAPAGLCARRALAAAAADPASRATSSRRSIARAATSSSPRSLSSCCTAARGCSPSRCRPRRSSGRRRSPPPRCPRGCRCRASTPRSTACWARSRRRRPRGAGRARWCATNCCCCRNWASGSISPPASRPGALTISPG